MAFFYNLLKKTTFACKGCDTTCEGVYQLMIHYEYSHGVNHGCTHSTAMVPGCRDGDTKRGDVGLIKVKKQVDFKFILGDLKQFTSKDTSGPQKCRPMSLNNF